MQGEGAAEDTLVVGAALPTTRSLSWVKALFGLLGGLVVLLLMSGTYLALRYVPDGTASHLFLLSHPEAPWLVNAARITHRICAWGILVAALALLGVGIQCAATRLVGWGRVGVAVPGAVVAFVASELWVRTARLAWDSIALESIRVGQNIGGVISIPDTTEYLLVGSDQVSPDTYQLMTWVHILVVPVVVFLVAALLPRVLASRRPS